MTESDSNYETAQEELEYFSAVGTIPDVRKAKLTVCPVCSKSITYYYLKRHLMIHTGEKPYKCMTCSKLFYDASGLARHHHIHSGVKPYKCVTCSKSFSRFSNLMRHNNLHTGKKPYKCVTCSKSFYRSSNLKRHYHTHGGEKSYNSST